MQIIKTITDLEETAGRLRAENQSIAFVPTMGYLHEGHVSLFQQAKALGDKLVASIFVNPLQFNDAEDYHKYPVDLDGDIQKAKSAGVDILFMPSLEEIYPGVKPGIKIFYPDTADKLCAKFRPDHFEGVLLIVHNLFQWIRPNTAVFGLKDYQQYILIKRMASDLHFKTKIIGAEIIREADGLAFSSRNARLTPEGRRKATKISAALFETRNAIRANAALTTGECHEILLKSLDEIPAEYAGIYDAISLEEIPRTLPPGKALIAIAAYIDGVRLIDNLLV